MHAVLESALEDNNYDGMHEAQKVRNHALIHYLASLANSNNTDDIFDFDFVESLIENGADVNSTDRNGQTIFHEIARSWNVDVALFLLEHGADLNQQDKFGRSPLHVAAAVDYAEMVRFLVKNGANINITTYGEQQMPIHYAAKNDACKSLKMLLGYGADIDSRDSKNRTPLQVAAEMNRAKSAKLLVQHGAPAGVHDNMGNSALCLLIEKLPDVAIEALDQFHSVSTINRKEFFFLNYLEGNRLQDPKSPAYSALEIAVQNQEFDIILHPAMKRLIDVKWQKFGRQGAVSSLGLNLLYAILWTVLAVTSPSDGDKLYLPWSRKAWRLVISVIVCLMTIDEIRKQVTGTLRTRSRQQKWISWRAAELEQDLRFCHPRWPQEEMYLKSEIKAIRDTPMISSGDSWIYFDWFSLFMILGTIASHVVFFNINSDLSQELHARVITILLLVLWLRIMQYARPFEGAGPFVAIFGHIMKDIINWGILTLLITIPYACAFWITFGEASRNPVASYSEVSSLIYGLFSMIVVNDHDFEALQAADATMARLLCGSYIAFMAVINLNILIALLSDTFTRVYGNAVANAVMQRAKTILFLEKSLTSKRKRMYEDFIKNQGSPETIELQRDISANADRDEQKASDLLKESVQEIHLLIHERFGKQYGEGKKSDLDHIRESLERIHRGSGIGDCGCKGMKRKVDNIRDILIKVSHSLKIDISGLDNQTSSTSDDDTLVPQIEGDVQCNENIDYENSSQITGLNLQGRNSDQRFWSVNKAAYNEGYMLDDEDAANSRQVRRYSLPINQFSVSGRKRFDTSEGEVIDLGRSSRSEDVSNKIPRDPRMMSYEQPRDGKAIYRSRSERRQFRSEVYQKGLKDETETSSPESRRKSKFSRAVFNGKPRVISRDGSPGKGTSRAEVRRTVSMPPRGPEYQPQRRFRESHPRTGSSRNSSRNLNTDSLRRPTAERRPVQKEFSPKVKRSPERRMQQLERRSSVQLKRLATRQRQPSIAEIYLSERAGLPSEDYHDERPRETPDDSRSEEDSEFSGSDDSQAASYDDNPNAACSDNDVFRKRAKCFRERRYLEDWDSRSVKSVAF